MDNPKFAVGTGYVHPSDVSREVVACFNRNINTRGVINSELLLLILPIKSLLGISFIIQTESERFSLQHSVPLLNTIVAFSVNWL